MLSEDIKIVEKYLVSREYNEAITPAWLRIKAALNKKSLPCRECKDFATIGARSFCIRKDKSVPCK